MNLVKKYPVEIIKISNVIFLNIKKFIKIIIYKINPPISGLAFYEFFLNWEDRIIV